MTTDNAPLETIAAPVTLAGVYEVAQDAARHAQATRESMEAIEVMVRALYAEIGPMVESVKSNPMFAMFLPKV